MKMKTLKTALLASALAAPAFLVNLSPVYAGPLGLPNGTSCDAGDPICVKDAAKWTAQDTAEGVKKAVGAVKDYQFPNLKPEGGAGISGVIGRQGQIIVETGEKIAHDRSGATKGYVDREINSGVNAAEKRVKEDMIGDLDSVADKAGVTGTGGGQWRTNNSGQVVKADGTVIRPHEILDGLGIAVDTKLKNLDGYFTVDGKGELQLHNAAGGTVYTPGELASKAAELGSKTLEGIGAAWSAGGAAKEAVGGKIAEIGKNHGWKLVEGTGMVIDGNGKILGAVGDIHQWGADALGWTADKLKPMGEEGVKNAGGFENGKKVTAGDILNNHQNRLDEQEEAVRGLGEVIGDVRDNLDDVDANVQRNSKDIAENSKGIAENKETLEQHNDELLKQADRIEKNTSDIADNGIRLDGHDKQIAENSKSIEEVNTKTDINTSNINQNSRAIMANQEDIAENTRRLDVGKNADGTDKTVKEYTDEGDAKTLVKAEDYADNRIGDLGNKAERDANGNVVLDANGKAKTVPNSVAPAAEGETADDRATVKDFADQKMAEGKAYVEKRYQELNERFDTTAGQSKAYTDATAQQTLKSANDYTDSKYNQLNGKIKKLRARADSGIAGATAIASLPFSEAGKNSLAGGLGVAKNKVAGAVGYQHNFSQNWRARATVSVSDNYVQGGAGVGYSW